MSDNVRFSNSVLYLAGVLNYHSIPDYQSSTNVILKKDKPLTIDISGITTIDSAGVAYLQSLEDTIKLYSSAVFIQGIPEKLKPVLKTFSAKDVPVEVKAEQIGVFEHIGNSIFETLEGFHQVLVMSADIFYWSFVGLFDRKGQRKGSFAQQGFILGVQALPVVSLLSLIIGFILSLQSAAQLRNFGANVFIADLLSISLVREMGPMMTAIIVAGRSGSSIASEIASMQVSEEIDALRMMAINPIRYVVVPKFHAITIVMPILVAFSILIGMLGGLIIAVTYLDLSVETFVNRSIDILQLKDVIVSFAKSTFFAWVIVIIGSYFGFSVKGGAEGVGRATTNSVVAAIFAVILFDAVFSLLYL
jgi:phospholipid/cholesterol/gamma-HCH transport system permease protein